MSGGSHNYCFSRVVEANYENQMHDAKLNALIPDLVKLFYELEWWQSGNTDEEQYRAQVKRFKKKWLSNSVDKEVVEKIKNDAIEEIKRL